LLKILIILQSYKSRFRREGERERKGTLVKWQQNSAERRSPLSFVVMGGELNTDKNWGKN
jgi:hypothetical protein